MQDEARLRRIEDATDLPLLVLALALIPLLILPEVTDLPDAVQEAFIAADWFIWAVFAADFAAKLAVAPNRIAYMRSHPFDLAMIVLPFLRPLRAARAVRFARVFVVAGLNADLIRDIAGRRGTQVIVGAVLLILMSGSTAVLIVERRDDAANITNFPDALWWGITTMTTVGYGDRYPVTAAGRGLAVFLMLFGIAALSVLTASIAAWLVRDNEEVELGEVMAEIRALRDEVAALRADRTVAVSVPAQAEQADSPRQGVPPI